MGCPSVVFVEVTLVWCVVLAPLVVSLASALLLVSVPRARAVALHARSLLAGAGLTFSPSGVACLPVRRVENRYI